MYLSANVVTIDDVDVDGHDDNDNDEVENELMREFNNKKKRKNTPEKSKKGLVLRQQL